MFSTIISVIISLVSVFLYVALGMYVLTKNPRERTNFIFVILMLVFIIWSMGTYNIGILTDNAPLEEISVFIKLYLSGVIISLSILVMFALSIQKKENPLKNPLTYITMLFSIYLLYLILNISRSSIENNIFILLPQKKLDFFLYSAVFGIAGVYALLRHYMTSKYRQQEQATIIMIGSFLAILVAIISNMILPMFFNIYLLPLSSLAPALMGMFFAYSVYRYGLYIKAVPEISMTSFCGVECRTCSQYIDKKCAGCRFQDSRYRTCDVYICITKKGYKDCGECPDILDCKIRIDNEGRCFSQVPGPTEIPVNDLIPGQTYFVKDDGYEKFLGTIKSSIYGLIVTTMKPQVIREKYGLITTPIVWISDEAFEDGVNPKNLKRLATVIINFMKKIENAVILIDDIDMLISINGYDHVQHVVQTMSSMSHITNNILIIQSKMDDDELHRMKPLYFKKKNLEQGQKKKHITKNM